MTINEVTTLQKIVDALGGAPEDMSEVVSAFSSFSFKNAPQQETDWLSKDFVDGLVDVVQQDGFLALQKSYPLLMLFQFDWSRFAPLDRVRICDVLTKVYERLVDHTAQLVVVELLAEYQADRTSLEALNDLSVISNPIARAHVAHGFGLLAANASDANVRQLATSSLQRMATDSSSVVVQEVANVLRK